MKVALLAAGTLIVGSALAPTPVKADSGLVFIDDDRDRDRDWDDDWDDDRRWDDRRDGRYGYRNGDGRYGYRNGDGRYAYQKGFERGYREGFKEADKDDDKHRRYDFRDDKDYCKADKGYKRDYGPFGAYSAGFRRGYQRGYDEGYGSGYGYRGHARPRYNRFPGYRR